MLEALKSEIKQRPIYSATLVVCLISLMFLALPELDLWVSSLFYDPQESFWLKNTWLLQRLRSLGIFAPRMIIILLLVFCLARLFWPALKKIMSLSSIMVLMLTALIGPGLIVNVLLKTHWGRARPVQTDLFGGDWPYSPVWVIVEHCEKNCSFVSGEGSMSFWLFGLLLLLPLAWRKIGFWVIAAFATLFSANRIFFGGHYLSDILMSWALTGLVMVMLIQLFRPSPAPAPDDRLELAWDNAGAWLRKSAKSVLKKSAS